MKIGQLNVILKATSGSEFVLSSRSRQEGDKWVPAQLNISPQSFSYNIIFEAVKGDSKLNLFIFRF